jgi:hypothetical protein
VEKAREPFSLGRENDTAKNPFFAAVLSRLAGMRGSEEEFFTAAKLHQAEAAISQGIPAEIIGQARAQISTLPLADWFAIFFLQRFFVGRQITVFCVEEALREAQNTAEKRFQHATPLAELVDLRELGRQLRAQAQIGR